MKKILIFLILGGILWSCNTPGHTSKVTTSKISKADTSEYEITIIDPEFDFWYAVNFSPAKDYANRYYRSQNQVAVSNWNDYYRRNKYRRVIENDISYDNSVDYGIDVNRKLFWYFKFIEEKYHVRVLM